MKGVKLVGVDFLNKRVPARLPNDGQTVISLCGAVGALAHLVIVYHPWQLAAARELHDRLKQCGYRHIEMEESVELAGEQR